MAALDRDHLSIQIQITAGRQHGHITRAQLLAMGVSHARVQRWCRAGRLVRAHAGVYAVGYRRVEPVAVAMAAVLACGDGSVLSHDSGAALWGWRRWPTLPEVTATKDRRRAGIRSHRTRSLPPSDRTRQLGVPVTSPERTIRDLERRLTRRQFAAIVQSARVQRRIDDEAVTRLLGYRPQPTRSEFERAFLRFCRRFGLPRPMTLAIVHGHEVDALFAEHGLIVELDGWDYHADRVAFANDRERDAFMLDHGLVTVRITWERLHEAGEREAGRLHRILGRRERELAALRAALIS
ncbi:MAG TPA: type IV toxin-antitoxin system AbiEi family antitoxin domain-containing protein [Solirubrobacteraceae bacterium]|nr:type IV toxin-antitoxin system AbiEi family antitoxin domain-containing protein [Solirubrobacteraceae bacterium]